MTDFLPVARPLLPSAEALYPYLRRIDAARVYSNFGPLALELEARLAAHFGLPSECAVTAVNGTSALTAALIAGGARRGQKCLVPSWSFCASAHAIVSAGLEPVFVDVDAENWMLAPAIAREALLRWPNVGAIMPVATDGRPVDVDAWDAFAADTGLAVVIDAAAGFANQRVGRSPIMVSLHATKVLGAGEGAVVLSQDAGMVQSILRALNFGFLGERVARSVAMNGKMSEYAAAVGLAALDAWPQTRQRWQALKGCYMERLAPLGLMRFDASDVSSTLSVRTLSDAENLARALRGRGIDTRRWYGDGIHAHPAFGSCAATPLPATEDLARHVIGLPFFIDMTTYDVDRVVTTLRDLHQGALGASAVQPDGEGHD